VSEISNETVASIERTLSDVDHALERLREGSYRSCETCGTEIDAALLTSDPVRTSCGAHPRLSEVEIS